MKNVYYRFSDGWFTYCVNIVTGEKKLCLEEGDVCVEGKLDDFHRD